MTQTARFLPPPLVALAAWLLPGAGYLLIGQRARGLAVGISILLLFVLGLLIGGVRVIEVPGFDGNGQRVRNMRLIQEVQEKPWFVGQILTGPVCMVGGWFSIDLAHQRLPRSHARVNEIGTLYTAVAGMLNLMAIIDSAYRGASRQG